jgi:putative hydrolase of the HAD superfamily
MNAIDLLVLDAHGVVLNNPLPDFLRRVALLTGQDPDSLRARWIGELRRPAWTGTMHDAELWRRLSGGVEYDWRALLEESYEPGPAAPFLEHWAECVPLWILSNHRSHWLEPRLERFGVRDHFERVLVSDQLGRVKPDAGAFAPLLEHVAEPDSILFLDDRRRNVDSARSLGIRAIQLDGSPGWRTQVENRIPSFAQ